MASRIIASVLTRSATTPLAARRLASAAQKHVRAIATATPRKKALVATQQHQQPDDGLDSFDRVNIAGSGAAHYRTRMPPNEVLNAAGDAVPGTIQRPHPVVWSDDASAIHQQRHALNAEQLATYREKGFIILPSFFSKDEVASIRDSIFRVRDHYEQMEVDERPAEVVTEPNGPAVRSVFAVHKSYDALRAIMADERLVTMAHQILDDDVYIHQSRINFQPAFRGSGFYWHSDFETWHAEDGVPVPRAFSAVVLLNDNTPQNGALMVMPGSMNEFVPCVGETPDDNWKTSLRSQVVGTPHPHNIRALADKHGITHCAAPQGSLLLFDSNLMHGSHSNISPYDRSNVFFVYNAVSNKAGAPFAARNNRPEHVATHDPAYMRPIAPLPAKSFMARKQ